jgi:hypothetical protein
MQMWARGKSHIERVCSTVGLRESGACERCGHGALTLLVTAGFEEKARREAPRRSVMLE